MMSCLPFCATGPVNAMLNPTLIGSAARAGARKDERNKTNKNKRAVTLRSLNIDASPPYSCPLTRLPRCTRKSTSPPWGEVDLTKTLTSPRREEVAPQARVRRSGRLPLSRACGVSLHHFVARQNTPQIRVRWILDPDFRALRIVAVPRPRLEIAELLVHAVELGESLGDQPVRRAVISEQIVADAVPPRSP